MMLRLLFLLSLCSGAALTLERSLGTVDAPAEIVRGYKLIAQVLSSGPSTLAAAAEALSRGSQFQVRQAGGLYEWLVEAQLGRGHVGEVFRAVRVSLESSAADADEDEDAPTDASAYVLKRLPAGAAAAQASGRREIFYGTRLQHPHISRFVEAWVDNGAGPGGGVAGTLWLAFRDEGVSLQALLYDAARPGAAGAATKGAAPVDGSVFFARLHADMAAGAASVRTLLRQVLIALAHLHRRGIVHRDLKPGNVLVSVDSAGRVRFRLADFGSAVGGGLPRNFYDDAGGELPGSQAEETLAYAPPEVRLSTSGVAYDALSPASYDSWSLGVLILEVILGIPADRLFDVEPREAARAAAHVPSGAPPEVAERAALAAGLRSRLCLPCGLPAFRQALRRVAWRRHWQVREAAAEAARAAAEGTAVVARAVPGDLAVSGAAAALAQLRGGFALVEAGSGTAHLAPSSGELVRLAPTTLEDLWDGEGGSSGGQRSSAEEQRQLVRAGALDALIAELAGPAATAAVQLLPAAAASAAAAAAAAGACAAASDAGALVEIAAEANGSGDSGAGSAGAAGAACTIDAPTPLLGEAGESLLHGLLAWEPAARKTAAAALEHQYFKQRGD